MKRKRRQQELLKLNNQLVTMQAQQPMYNAYGQQNLQSVPPLYNPTQPYSTGVYMNTATPGCGHMEQKPQLQQATVPTAVAIDIPVVSATATSLPVADAYPATGAVTTL
jgi:hypothetical protein